MRVLVTLLAAVLCLAGCGLKPTTIYLWPPTEVSDTPN